MRKGATLAVVADGKGQFVAKPLYDWRMNSILGERWPLRGRVEISAEGFSSQSRDLQWPLTGHTVKDLGEISLEPKSGGNP